MSYESIDKLQKVLADDVFNYAKDSKKAAGRALGTLVEIITFYLFKSYGFEHSIAIERALAEYGNPDITHNVEYSLHPVLRDYTLTADITLPITSTRIYSNVNQKDFSLEDVRAINATLLTADNILRNSCLIGYGEYSQIMADLEKRTNNTATIAINEQCIKPYALVECKRVGVEEGMRKGPQTIEKAKQGAYVARSVSSLHKVRLPSGKLHGLIFRTDDDIYIKPYEDIISDVIGSDDPKLLCDFVFTVGVVSNHGNWFTSDDHNKELKVLAQSYDWLIFLTDAGLSEFIVELLLKPTKHFSPVRDAFLASYSTDKVKNRFTKVQMDYDADQLLQEYFTENNAHILGWFNIITPKDDNLKHLMAQLSLLREKDWSVIHSL